MTTPTDLKESILDTMRQALLPKPHEATLRKLEADLAVDLAPLVQATYGPDGTVTVQVSETRHTGFTAKIGVTATCSAELTPSTPKVEECQKTVVDAVLHEFSAADLTRALHEDRAAAASFLLGWGATPCCAVAEDIRLGRHRYTGPPATAAEVDEALTHAVVDGIHVGPLEVATQQADRPLDLPPCFHNWNPGCPLCRARGTSATDVSALIRRAEAAEAQVSTLREQRRRAEDALLKLVDWFTARVNAPLLQPGQAAPDAWESWDALVDAVIGLLPPSGQAEPTSLGDIEVVSRGAMEAHQMRELLGVELGGGVEAVRKLIARATEDDLTRQVADARESLSALLDGCEETPLPTLAGAVRRIVQGLLRCVDPAGVRLEDAGGRVLALRQKIDQLAAHSKDTPEDDLTKPPPGFNVSRLPQSLQKSIDTANAWGPSAIVWAWSIELEDRARRNLGWPDSTTRTTLEAHALLTRTDFEIIGQTNELARTILQIEGYSVHQEYLFWAADTARAKRAWEMARQAQLALTAKDPNDALSNVGWADAATTECDDHSKPPPGFDPNRLPESLQKTIRTNGVWRAEALSEAWLLVYQDRAKQQQAQARQLLGSRNPRHE